MMKIVVDRQQRMRKYSQIQSAHFSLAPVSVYLNILCIKNSKAKKEWEAERHVMHDERQRIITVVLNNNHTLCPLQCKVIKLSAFGVSTILTACCDRPRTGQAHLTPVLRLGWR